MSAKKTAKAGRPLTYAELISKLAVVQARADEHLTAIRTLLDEHRKDRAETDAEIAYWTGEVSRLHHELIEIHRERARDGVS